MMLGGATAEHVQSPDFFHTHGWELSVSMNNVRHLRNRVSRAWLEYEVAYDVIRSNAFDAADAMMESTVEPPISHRMDHSQEYVSFARIIILLSETLLLVLFLLSFFPSCVVVLTVMLTGLR